MSNLLFELERLRVSLENKGFDRSTADQIVNRAQSDIYAALNEQADAALQLAIETGVEKRSPDFINEIMLDPYTMQLITESGNMDFSEPPRPMLPQLLKNAKPMKDGSGIYKIIPVGEPGNNRPKIASNIYDAWKQINTERIENARAQQKKIAPKNSKAKFRTATSKQDQNTKWVQPAQTKDFSEDLHSINTELGKSMEDIIRDVIRDYEDNF